MNTYDCIVVGAGISGLSAAYELHRRGANMLMVEARAVPGGSMRSEQTAESFILENGPNTVVSSDPALDEHFAALGIADERLVADRKGARRYILINGKLELIPMSPPAFFRSPVLSTPAKFRMFIEPLIPRARTSDESVATFFARRLGPEPAQRLIDPFVSGVYAGDPAALSVESTFPTIWKAEQEYGSIVLGMILGSRKKKKKKGPRRRSQMLSFRSGLQSWPEAIAKALGPERAWFNSPATGLQPAEGGWNLTVTREGTPQTLFARQVVLATPADVTAMLLSSFDQAAAQALQDIPYSPISVVHLGYRRADVDHPMDGFGMLCPSGERRRVLGTLWPSTLFPGRTPDGAVLTTSFVGGARRPELARQDEEELIESVIQEQRDIVGARADPIFVSVARWERAISQYVAGHADRIAKLDRLENMFHGLHVIGNYRDGVSVEKCWHKGHELGRHLALPTAAPSVGMPS